MRYCPYCHRLSLGQPLYCRFCSRSYDVRICRSCHSVNDLDVLVCGNCGGRDFSEPAGSSPFWLVLVRVFFWIFLVFGLIKFLFLNFELIAGFIIILGFLYLSYLYLLPCAQRLIKQILKAVKDGIGNNQRRE